MDFDKAVITNECVCPYATVNWLLISSYVTYLKNYSLKSVCKFNQDHAVVPKMTTIHNEKYNFKGLNFHLALLPCPWPIHKAAYRPDYRQLFSNS